MTMTPFSQVCCWYASQCNGQWEHEYGIKIETLDNPGWSVEIDLAHTDLERAVLEKQLVEVPGRCWHFAEIRDKKFHGACDPDSLEIVLDIFLRLMDERDLGPSLDS
ncbi:MAG: rhodanese-related sulfurtransferase [Planctomycetaceae bacterium]|nr:rhodanese-related sulfurtransferase [Planctomycetaceae bacterium]